MKICANCGTQGEEKKTVGGSVLIELGLWFFFVVAIIISRLAGLVFFIAAIAYSIWRLTSAKKACPKCGAANMVPLDSPIGKTLAEKFPVAPEIDRDPAKIFPGSNQKKET